MDRMAYFVAGPESSATRFVTELFIDAGCFGDAGHSQRLDRMQKLMKTDNKPNPLVIRRSVPHDARMPNMQDMSASLENYGYTTFFVFLMRDWFPLIHSKVSNKHQPNEHQAVNNLRLELQHIMKYIVESQPLYYVLNTSFLFTNPQQSLCSLSYFTGLTFPSCCIEKVTQADNKYWR